MLWFFYYYFHLFFVRVCFLAFGGETDKVILYKLLALCFYERSRHTVIVILVSAQKKDQSFNLIHTTIISLKNHRIGQELVICLNQI